MNKLFWEYLKQYTDTNFELIIIDNNSNDGSREFFCSLVDKGENVVLIENDANYSYPYCQNQGIVSAKGDILVFLNNDLLVSSHWDSRMLEVIGVNGNEVISFASNDRIGSAEMTKRLSRRWKRIKYPVMTIFGQKMFALKLSTQLCYGNWERYCEKIFNAHGLTLLEGFSGSAIAMTRRGLEKIGEWDNTQYSADFDLFYRTLHRHENVGDMKPLCIINGVFMHHYRRLTAYQKYPPFADAANLSTLERKWSREDLGRWNNRIKEF